MNILDIGNNKTKCQHFTPERIADTMLDLAEYNNNLIGKAVLENSFGSGNILKAIVKRYIAYSLSQNIAVEDIAKNLGISASMVTACVNHVLNTLKKDKKAMEILSDIQDSYNESLMFDIMNLDKDQMIEAILSDNTFILLEELTKWSDKNVYINTITNAIEGLDDKEKESIKNILLGDFNYLDKVFKSNRKTIVKFLGLVNPTESYSRKTDVSILEYMEELGGLYKKYFK